MSGVMHGPLPVRVVVGREGRVDGDVELDVDVDVGARRPEAEARARAGAKARGTVTAKRDALRVADVPDLEELEELDRIVLTAAPPTPDGTDHLGEDADTAFVPAEGVDLEDADLGDTVAGGRTELVGRDTELGLDLDLGGESSRESSRESARDTGAADVEVPVHDVSRDSGYDGDTALGDLDGTTAIVEQGPTTTCAGPDTAVPASMRAGLARDMVAGQISASEVAVNGNAAGENAASNVDGSTAGERNSTSGARDAGVPAGGSRGPVARPARRPVARPARGRSAVVSTGRVRKPAPASSSTTTSSSSSPKATPSSHAWVRVRPPRLQH